MAPTFAGSAHDQLVACARDARSAERRDIIAALGRLAPALCSEDVIAQVVALVRARGPVAEPG